ncbi:hypothetical protein BT69DRAFT_1288762, partial [Atractiella rhizophila]
LSYTTVVSFMDEGLSTGRDISPANLLSLLSPEEVVQAFQHSLTYIPGSPLAMAFQAAMNGTAHNNRRSAASTSAHLMSSN